PGKRNSTNGPDENERNRGLASTTKPQRRPRIPRIHGFLSILRPQLLEDCTPPHRAHTESSPFPMGRTTIQSVRDAQNTHVCTTRPTPTRLHATLLPLHRRLGLRRGSRTLTGGRTQPTHQKTHTTPNRILLSDVQPHRTQLRHLRKRTVGNHEGPRTLATPSSRHA